MKLGRFDVPGHYTGDCRALLAELPDACVQMCVTSPPYWGLRDYGVGGQLGLEPTPEAFVANLVDVFRGVRRVLRDDGTLWLNLGDSYAGGGRGGYPGGKSGLDGSTMGQDNSRAARGSQKAAGFHEAQRLGGAIGRAYVAPPPGLKHKDLVGIPWMVAFALRSDGWYLRSDIIWHKPNPMPSSVEDRPTTAHEYMFLLSKKPSYFYDADAIREPLADKTLTTFGSKRRSSKGNDPLGKVASDNWARDVPDRKPRLTEDGEIAGANKRSVWTIAPQPYDGAHFATYPPKLIEPCILAGSAPGDVVLDPFFGSGTTGEVAERHGRRWLGFDLNPAYEQLQRERTAQRSLLVPR